MSRGTVKAIDLEAGGIRPRPRIRSERVLSLKEHEEISRTATAGPLRPSRTVIFSLKPVGPARWQGDGGRREYRATATDHRPGSGRADRSRESWPRAHG